MSVYKIFFYRIEYICEFWFMDDVSKVMFVGIDIYGFIGFLFLFVMKIIDFFFD